MAIPLYEDFASPLGEFLNYDTYDAAQRTQLAEQKHVDLRSFQGAVTRPYTMYDLDGQAMSALDALTMRELETGNIYVPGESWSNGAIGPQADRNNFAGISLVYTIGSHATSSTIAGPNGIASIDISTFTNADYLSLSLPDFPETSLTLASCFLDLTSDPQASFASHTDSLSFTSATGLVNGDCEAQFPLSLLSNVDRTAITGVRLRFSVTDDCTIRCLAIRCIATTWKYARVDQNTLYERLCATVPPSGSLTQPTTFPTALPALTPLYPDTTLYPATGLLPGGTFAIDGGSASANPSLFIDGGSASTIGGEVDGGSASSHRGTPSDWPILIFSDGSTGPAPVDMDVGAVLHTGSNLGANQFALYFREYPMLVRTMQDLDAMSMEQIEELGRQPDFDPGTLDDFSETWYYAITLNWGTTSTVTIADPTGAGYSFPVTLATDTDYYLLVTLSGNSIRVQIYPLLYADDIVNWLNPTFDSTAVIDSVFIKRRNGRFGWYAHLEDGDTYVRHLRPRKVVYSEYRSLPLYSQTPVVGARLYSDSTPNQGLFHGIRSARPGTTVTPDITKSSSGRCVKVVCDGQHLLQGFTTDAERFENLEQSLVALDVLAPTSAQLTALLIGETRVVQLYIQPLPTNRWTHLTIPLDRIARRLVPGSYSLALLQSKAAPAVWYIDNLSIETRNVAWSGRGRASDPWSMNDPTWIPFNELINDPYAGALLGRGNALQVRGQVLSQVGTIGQVTILPKYAELGNFSWPEQAPVYGPGPSPSFTSSLFGFMVTCDASLSTAANGILDYYWNFGDGTYGYGETISHAYLSSGTYTITLTVIDKLTLKTSTFQNVTVVSAFSVRPTVNLHLTGILQYIGARALTAGLSPTASLATVWAKLPSATLYPSTSLYP